MPEYIFVTMDVPRSEGIVQAHEVVGSLLSLGFWAFSDSAPVAQKIGAGDSALVYVGGKDRHYFVARCLVKDGLEPSSCQQHATLSDLGLGFMRRTLPLQSVHWFPEPVRIKPLINQLQFIKDKKNYGLSLRLPARQIPTEDFDLIVTTGTVDSCDD